METSRDDSFNSILVGMFPTLPELPELPKMTWEYSNGRYSICEEDADRLLDYGENLIPLYLHEMELYVEKIEILKETLGNN